jgi:hypothetical protein
MLHQVRKFLPWRRPHVTHIAVQEALNGKVVDWMEKVGDEQYRG